MYFAECFASDILQITRITNSTFCKIHLPVGDCVVVFSSVVTVSHWLRSVGFGSVLS